MNYFLFRKTFNHLKIIIYLDYRYLRLENG